jgi:type I restriction enzyme S subunit
MRPGIIPVYGGNGISGHHDQSNVEHPTIVVGRVGFYCGTVYASPAPIWVTDNAIFANQLPIGCELEYLRIAFAASDLKLKAQGGAQPFINQKILNEIQIPLPSSEEQVEIVRRVLVAFGAADDAEKQFDAEAADAARLKQSILKAAFEGRLAPQDPNDEPASALLERLGATSDGPSSRGRKRRVPAPLAGAG